jgi:hypothetical protein
MKPEQVPVPAGIAMDKGLKLLEIEKHSGTTGSESILALIQKVEREMFTDGSKRSREIKALNRKEGEMR